MDRRAVHILVRPYVCSIMANLARKIAQDQAQGSVTVHEAVKSIRMREPEFEMFLKTVCGEHGETKSTLLDLFNNVQLAWVTALVEGGVMVMDGDSSGGCASVLNISERGIWESLCKSVLNWFSRCVGHTQIASIPIGAAVHTEVIDDAIDTLLMKGDWVKMRCAWRMEMDEENESELSDLETEGNSAQFEEDEFEESSPAEESNESESMSQDSHHSDDAAPQPDEAVANAFSSDESDNILEENEEDE